MRPIHKPLISIVIPCYNESDNIASFSDALSAITSELSGYRYEFIYVNDGSTDGTLSGLQRLAAGNKRLKIISFSRNFGKEMATTAGIRAAEGDAVILIDGDGQHPVATIPLFLSAWRSGSQVVIGVRSNAHQGVIKKLTSRLFYWAFNHQADLQLVPGSTDFRLIDRVVQREFSALTEHGRITRGLIDWLGFRREYVPFEMASRAAGSASYGYSKLVGLALNSFVSLSLRPLYLLAYAGLGALGLSIALAIFSAVEMLLGDPLRLYITGSAYLVMLVLFLVGVILISQGVLALYISHIHTEAKNRPLYIVDREASRGIKDTV